MDLRFLPEYFHVSQELLHAIVILLLTWLLISVSRRLIRMFRDYMYAHSSSAEHTRRNTGARIPLHFVRRDLVGGRHVALSELGVSIAPILGAAGMVGVAVGFGAQSLIKDYFNGFFILLENRICHGDVVEVCDKLGVVEDVTLRHITLCDYEGSVRYVSNGQTPRSPTNPAAMPMP